MGHLRVLVQPGRQSHGVFGVRSTQAEGLQPLQQQEAVEGSADPSRADPRHGRAERRRCCGHPQSQHLADVAADRRHPRHQSVISRARWLIRNLPLPQLKVPASTITPPRLVRPPIHLVAFHDHVSPCSIGRIRHRSRACCRRCGILSARAFDSFSKSGMLRIAHRFDIDALGFVVDLGCKAVDVSPSAKRTSMPSRGTEPELVVGAAVRYDVDTKLSPACMQLVMARNCADWPRLWPGPQHHLQGRHPFSNTSVVGFIRRVDVFELLQPEQIGAMFSIVEHVRAGLIDRNRACWSPNQGTDHVQLQGLETLGHRAGKNACSVPVVF